MADNLIIEIDGDASHLEKELNNAAGTGVRAFKRFSDGTNEQLDRMQDMVDDMRLKLIEMGEDGEEAMEDFGDAGKRALDGIEDEAKDAGKKTGDSMENAAKRAETAWNKVQKLLKTIAGAAVVREVVKIGKEAVNLASDLDEVQNVIDVTFGEGNEKVEAFAQNAARQFGISELSAKKMTGTMGAMLKSLDVDNVDDMAISLVGLAADMGSSYNMEAEDAFAKLRSGISGQTQPLKELGINMSEASLEAFALSSGVKKAYKDMSEAEKTTLRYNFIMNATADAQGDFSRTSGSMANQLKIASLNVENMKAALGKALLPAATVATTAMNNFMTNVQNGFPKIKEVVTAFGENVKEKLGTFGLWDRLTAGLSRAKKAINEGLDFILKIIGAVASSPVFQAIGDALGNAFSSILGLWDTLSELLAALEPIWEGLKAGANDFVNAFLSAKLMMVTIFNEAVTFIQSALELIIGILTLDKEKIKNGFTGMKNSLIAIAKAIWTGITAVLSSMWAGIVKFLSTVKNKIGLFGAAFKPLEWGKNLMEKLKNGINEGWTAIKTWFTTTKDAALEALAAIDLKQAGLGLLNSLKSGVTEKWEEISTWLSEKKQFVIDTISGIDLKEVGSAVINSLKEGFEEKWAGVVSWFQEAVENLTGWLPDSIKEKLGLQSNITLSDDSGELHKGPQKVLTGPVPAAEYYGGMAQTRYDLPGGQAAESLEEAAEALTDAAETLEKKSGDASNGDLTGRTPETIVLEAAETVADAVSELPEAAESAIEEAVDGLTDAVDENTKAAEALSEQTESLSSDIDDDGLTFSLDDESLSGIGEVIEDSDLIDDSSIQEQTDHLGNLWDTFTGLFKDQSEETHKKLDGIDTDINKGLGNDTGIGSDYTLLDEYNELAGLWSNNKDKNGEWIADWSEGGIGQTLANLIQDKLPGLYWGDLTPEDLERMGQMTASDGYVQGQYEARFNPQEPVTIPAALDVISVEMDGTEGDVLDLSALTEIVPDETILSWQSLNQALQDVMDTIGGGETGSGLVEILSSISDLAGTAIPASIDAMSTGLSASLPRAIQTSLQFLGEVVVDDDGTTHAGAGNTLYTALGSIKGLFEDSNVAIDLFCKGLAENIPGAVEVFKVAAGPAIGRLESLRTTAANAASAFGMLADAIGAVADALGKLNGAGGIEGGGGSGIFAAAHGGQHRGIGLVGENGPEIISTSRNLNVFTNHALKIAQEKAANLSAKRSYALDAQSPQFSRDDLLALRGDDSSVNVTVEGSIYGESWLQNYVVKTMRGEIRKELSLAR